MRDATRVEIEYCTQCRWLLRASWMAQELLTTFDAEIGGVALIPGTGGIFEVRAGDRLLWSRHEKKRFPEIKELKQLVRDVAVRGEPRSGGEPSPSMIEIRLEGPWVP